jgi:putative ABC transport system substrate-binding protein
MKRTSLPLQRRQFITFLGGAAAWPLAARAQQGGRMRRIGVLAVFAADDPEAQARNAGFLQGLQDLGWSVGRNVQIDYRWSAGDVEHTRQYAAELVALAPDVILATGSATVVPLQQMTRTLPIVFVQITDPVGAGIVESLARPGANVTGFSQGEYSMGGKWLELLKQVAPRVTRAAVVRDPAIAVGVGQFGAVQSAAASFGLELSTVTVRDAGEIERAIPAFASKPNGSLIVLSGQSVAIHRNLIIALATRFKLPAIYPFRYFVADGGLVSYGPDSIDPYRRAAGYVDRILKGECEIASNCDPLLG